jgi:hypothetical protein
MVKKKERKKNAPLAGAQDTSSRAPFGVVTYYGGGVERTTGRARDDASQTPFGVVGCYAGGVGCIWARLGHYNDNGSCGGVVREVCSNVNKH